MADKKPLVLYSGDIQEMGSEDLIPLANIPQILIGKDADTVDGYHHNQSLLTTTSPTFAGLTLSGLTDGGVLFADSNSVISQNSDLFWDNTNKRLGIGTTNPEAKLEIAGQVKITGGAPGAGKVLTSDASGLATWETIGETTGSGIPTGVIIRSSSNTPSGYLYCNGALLSSADYPNLYAVIGNSFNYYANKYINGRPWRQQYKTNLTRTSNITNWTTGTSLPGGLYGSQAIVTNSRVYLLGGHNGSSAVSTVYTATINSDGTLGTWTTGTSLPGALYACQAIVTNSRVYLLGGYNGSATVSTVYTAPINSDGTLGTWTTGTSLPGGLEASQAIVTNSRVYLLGGYNGSSAVSTVYTAPINSDGTLGTWTTGTSLPGGLAGSQAIVTNSRVYLLGGGDGSSAVSTVYTAPINSDGTLGTWTTGTSLPGGLYRSQAIVTNSRVYLLGGYNDSSVFSIVYTAPINSDGTLGTWTTGTSLPGGLYRSQAIVTNSRVYLLGGWNDSSVVSTVYTAPFSGGKNNYMNDTFYQDTPPSGYFYIPDLTYEEAVVNNTVVRSYIKY
jgi:N-acetylneuraminic acid mutarotase